ncbi:TIM barrel protein [Candidatus Poribacteria bacterium]|nr:TIM barrel protein [Candidatus Poribacteria bacterium]
MTNKLAIITGFLGGVRNRYMVYQDDRNLAEKIRMAAEVENISGLEVCYPADFEDKDQLLKLLSHYQLEVSAVNFRSRRTGKWLRGSFSSQKAHERKEVVEDLKAAMALAVELACRRITTCPLNEGHDYPFEINYGQALDFFEETVSEAASAYPDVKLCIEYKMNDPRARCLLGNAGETLAFCQRIGLPNVGVTLDFGHAIQAGERPAQSAVMLARAERLFYVHLNDNDKFWDWDMIPGAYNFWEFIEFFYYLEKLGYNDWFAYDVTPKEIDTVGNFEVVTSNTLKLMEIASRLDPERMDELWVKRDPSKSVKYLYSML